MIEYTIESLQQAERLLCYLGQGMEFQFQTSLIDIVKGRDLFIGPVHESSKTDGHLFVWNANRPECLTLITNDEDYHHGAIINREEHTYPLGNSQLRVIYHMIETRARKKAEAEVVQDERLAFERKVDHKLLIAISRPKQEKAIQQETTQV